MFFTLKLSEADRWVISGYSLTDSLLTGALTCLVFQLWSEQEFKMCLILFMSEAELKAELPASPAT